MKVNSKLLQQHLIDTTGKVVTLKDIRNVQTGIHTQSDKNNLEALVARLRQIHGMCSQLHRLSNVGGGLRYLAFSVLTRCNFSV